MIDRNTHWELSIILPDKSNSSGLELEVEKNLVSLSGCGYELLVQLEKSIDILNVKAEYDNTMYCLLVHLPLYKDL